MSWAKNSTAVYQELEEKYLLQSGEAVTATFRDAVVPEHPMMALMHATLRSIRDQVEYRGERVSREVKDSLIKTSMQI